MRWVVLLLLVAGVIGGPALLSDREQGCRHGVAYSPGDFRDAADRGAASPEEAVGSSLAGAARTTQRDETGPTGDEVTVLRGYDADDHLLTTVEVHQDEAGRWFAGASWVCS